METVRQKVSRLPDAPGVYFFKDSKGVTLYIGKAKSLKKRVQSYFGRALDAKTQILVSKIADLEYRLTSSDSHAQILEASLISALQPHYNVDLKDDKSFPWIRITKEQFPRVGIYRKRKQSEEIPALYFGPFTNAALLKEALQVIRRIFGFRTCRIMPHKPCLYYRVKLCPAPCAGKVAPVEYQALIKRLILFLNSRYEELMQELRLRMQEASAQRLYEDAAQMRDQIASLSAFSFTPHVQAGISELACLRKILKLPKMPLRIEGFDISNISGREATGSMVSFYKGKADKNNYRRFRIKTVGAIDDYGMIREVVRRRYGRLLREGKDMPDVVLIDGGKGHLLAAEGVLKDLGARIPCMSIAKEKENIYISGRELAVTLREGSLALNLIRRVRDEAHRFARAYHHLLRRKKIIGN